MTMLAIQRALAGSLHNCMRCVLGVLLAIAIGCTLNGGALADEPGDWRAAAEARIERIRKADITVRVVDRDGMPISNADVTVRMTRHAFPFGTCVNAGLLVRGTEFAKAYRERIPQLFNIAVTENDLKWPTWEGAYPDFNHADSLAGLRWVRERGIAIRGHNLVWPSWQWTPKDLKGLKSNPDALRKRVRDHIVSILADTRGLCDEWDVVNEPFSHHDLIDVLGRDEIVEWFKLARANTPENCKLYINDFDNLEGGLDGANEPHRKHYEDTIQFLIDHGAPLDGVGLQCHFGGKRTLTSPEDLATLLDRFARFGKELKI